MLNSEVLSDLSHRSQYMERNWGNLGGNLAQNSLTFLLTQHDIKFKFKRSPKVKSEMTKMWFQTKIPLITYQCRDELIFSYQWTGRQNQIESERTCDTCATRANIYTVSMETRHGWPSKTFSPDPSRSFLVLASFWCTYSSPLWCFCALVYYYFEFCFHLTIYILYTFNSSWHNSF